MPSPHTHTFSAIRNISSGRSATAAVGDHLLEVGTGCSPNGYLTYRNLSKNLGVPNLLESLDTCGILRACSRHYYNMAVIETGSIIKCWQCSNPRILP